MLMKLIVGFGNPGNQYNFTRHNFGFLALDFYAKVKGIKWEDKPKFNALWAKGEVAPSFEGHKTWASAPERPEKERRDSSFILIKPQTFYNDVGQAIQAFSHYYKIKPADILVVCDDFNLAFGKLRYRESGSAGGNNGLKSTISCLNTEDFPRLRLGTGSDLRARTGDTDFVLGKFSAAEREQLPAILRETVSKLDELISNY